LSDPSATIGPGDNRGFCLLGGLELASSRPNEDVSRHPGIYGWGGWASTIFRVSPASGIVFVFMTNCIGVEERVEKLLLRRVGEALRDGEGSVADSRPRRWWLAWPITASWLTATAALLAALAAGLVARRVRAGAKPLCAVAH